MNRITLLLSGLIFCSVFLSAQTVEPDNPDIVLPEIVLELEGESITEVETVLPDDVELYTPELEFEMPPADELEIALDILEVPVEDPPSVDTAREDAIFTEGSIGLGNSNKFIGEISLYKIGLEPRFNVSFYHQILDGFQFNESGAGYLKRDDTLTVDLSYEADTWELGTAFGYYEQETGLQGQSDYISILNRDYQIGADLVFHTAGVIDLLTGVDSEISSATLTGETPARTNEFNAIPYFGAEISNDNSYFKALLDYNAYTKTGTTARHGFNLGLFGGIEFKNGWATDLSGGLSWYYGDEILIPFKISFAALFADFIDIDVQGGFRDYYLTDSKVADDLPFHAQPSTFPRSKEWFADLKSEITVLPQFKTKLDLAYQYATNLVVPAVGQPDEATGLYSLTTASGNYLTAGLGMELELGQSSTMDIVWQSQLLPDKNPLYADHSALADYRYRSELENFGFDIHMDWDIDSIVYIPVLDFSTFYTIADGLDLILEGSDLLSPFYDPGRVRLNNGVYIEPGLIITLKTQISL